MKIKKWNELSEKITQDKANTFHPLFGKKLVHIFYMHESDQVKLIFEGGHELHIENVDDMEYVDNSPKFKIPKN